MFSCCAVEGGRQQVMLLEVLLLFISNPTISLAYTDMFENGITVCFLFLTACIAKKTQSENIAEPYSQLNPFAYSFNTLNNVECGCPNLVLFQSLSLIVIVAHTFWASLYKTAR